MNVYTCVDFEGAWPVGVAAVVVAESEEHARALLVDALTNACIYPRPKPLDPFTFTLQRLDTTKPSATLLADGDY